MEIPVAKMKGNRRMTDEPQERERAIHRTESELDRMTVENTQQNQTVTFEEGGEPSSHPTPATGPPTSGRVSRDGPNLGTPKRVSFDQEVEVISYEEEQEVDRARIKRSILRDDSEGPPPLASVLEPNLSLDDRPRPRDYPKEKWPGKSKDHVMYIHNDPLTLTPSFAKVPRFSRFAS